MNKACWIWYFGEFEIYHSLLVHSRREDIGCDYPCMWAVDTPYPLVEFKPKQKLSIKEDTIIHVHANGKGVFWLDYAKFPIGKDVLIKKGEYNLQVNVMCTDGSFPCIFIDNEYVKTNKNWTADFGDRKFIDVGYEPLFLSNDSNPLVFPFSYKKLSPVSIEKTDNGTIYDFGKETFSRITLNTDNEKNEIFICYGESKEEANDSENAIIFEHLSGKKQYILNPRAFRFIRIKGDNVIVNAEYEYLPIESIAKFKCDDDNINNIFKVSDYTFHLNSREFYLDGIKRDRWVWSGDAYQSFMVNNYLYRDKDIIKRTIIALLGKPPIVQHINTINDYSMYLILSIYDYYYNYNDIEFIKRIYDRTKMLFDFIIGRLDDEGYVYEREEDWVFIDWANIDKSGPTCAEQILLWKTYQAMTKLSDLCGEKSQKYLIAADKLKDSIMADFWNNSKGAFIDCKTSGKNKINRHANIFAILYDFVDENTQNQIYNSVLKNDDIEPITTPFFKLYELMALCKLGDKSTAFDFIKSYWGEMLSLGATSVWEQFDPKQQGMQHYEMYGAKFGKSLCHAWGSGPILLLLKYFVGVKYTDINAKHYIISPDLKYFKNFNCIVPVGDGTVEVKYLNNDLEILATVDGGHLVINNKTYELIKNKKIIVNKKDLI